MGASLLFACLGWSCMAPIYSRLGVLMLLSVPVLSFAGLRGMAPGLETAVALAIACAMAAVRLRIGIGRRFQNDDDDDA